MSYCRWSSDNGYCDLYVYEEGYGGYTTHVAKLRQREGAPQCATDYLTSVMGAIPGDWHAQYVKRVEAGKAWREANPPLPIGGPHDGETFWDDGPSDLKARLLELRAAGYRFPDYVLEMVDEDIREYEPC